MGIRGLNSFFDNNPGLSPPFKLFDTHLVIDGNNLTHQLYYGNKLDCLYGGDYNRFSTIVRTYFINLLKCHVRPIVIFDGGHDISDRKIEKILEKWRSRLSQVTKLSKSLVKFDKCNGNVLPINLHQVFRKVISELGIPSAQCDFEADEQITALANYYNCPVLSNDSDFYIFDIRNGFIRQSFVRPVDQTVIDGRQCKYIPCRIYNIDNFLSYLPGFDKNVLPLFGTLMGNDYVDSKVFERFFSYIRISEPVIEGLRFDSWHKKTIELLIWLAKYSLEEAIDQVVSHLSDSQRDVLKPLIVKSVEVYGTQKCILTNVIEGDLKRFEEDLKSDGMLTTRCGQALPMPFMLSFHEGKLPNFFLNIIHHHRLMLSPQVEDPILESSYSCSRYIRQILYGLLLQHKNCQDKNCRRGIEEYDRREETSVTVNVMPIFILKNGNPLPYLCEVYSLKNDSLQDIISVVLGTELSYMLSVPSELQLLFACLNYWLKNCFLKPKEEFLYALVINLIYFKYIRKIPVLSNAGTHSNISNALNKVSEADASKGQETMRKYSKWPTFTWRDRDIISPVHSFSELQTCIYSAVCLNMLLRYPFEPPKMHESFSGPLVQNLTKELVSCRSPDLIVSELFGGTSYKEIFDLLIRKILQNVSSERYERIASLRRIQETKKVNQLNAETTSLNTTVL